MKRHRLSAQSERTSWSIADGRQSVGRVELRRGAFVAIDLAGHVVGRFPSLHEAAGALEAVDE
jgi:hypothetical protein